MRIAATAIVHNGVVLEPPTILEDFVIVGAGNPPEENPATRIGANSLLRSHTVVYAGNRIGAGFQTGHGVLIRELNDIGDQVSIGSHSVVEHHVRIADRVRLHSNVFVPEYSLLEADAWLGPNVCITNADHPRCPNIPHCLRGVIVESGAKIGANATLLPGVRIGAGALVGAGSVVTRDIPPRMVAVGNPAKLIKAVDELVCPHDMLTRPYRSS